MKYRKCRRNNMSGTYSDIKRIDRKLIHKGKVIDYYQDTMELPDHSTTVWDFIAHDGAAAIVPVTDDGRILMVRQYRNTAQRAMLEIPAGKKDTAGEPGEVCAARELEEETGYRAGKLEKLTTIYPSVAYCGETIDLYIAEQLTGTSQHLDADEYLNVEAYTLQELTGMIMDGQIDDAKTVAAILMYKEKSSRK